MSRLSKAALFGFLIGLVGLSLTFFPFAHDIEEAAGLGLLFKLRGAREAPPNVVVVSIDRESSERLGVSNNPDRWPRTLHASLVDALVRQGARVIVFDVYFIEPRSAEEDNGLGAAIEKARNVVLAEPLRTIQFPSPEKEGSDTEQHRIVQIVKPIDPLAQSAVATAPFVLPRIPVRVNQYWTFQSSAGDSPTFPVVAFQLYALPVYEEFVQLLRRVSPSEAGKLPRDADTAIKAKGAVRLIREIREIFESDPLIEKKMIAKLDRSRPSVGDRNHNALLKALIKMYGGADRRYLNYYGPPRTISTLPFYQALQLRDDSGNPKQIDLKGKTVFVGFSEILLAERQDSFHTVFSQANGVFVSGVEIAATAFSNLLEDTAVTMLRPHAYLLLILAWGILVGVVCRLAGTIAAALGVVSLSLLYLVAAEYQFKADGTWYPVVVPLFLQTPLGFFGAVLCNYFETNKERQNIRKALGYYVPDEVVDQLARNRADMKKGDQTAYGACLFTDAAGYTTLSETMGPRELSEFMHKYFEATFAPIEQNGGLVVDLKGDSILALWKAPQPEATLRKQACHAALGLAEAVSQFNQSSATLKLPTRIGVHGGPIFLGNIGAGDHYRYGPTGDTVNTASRMDGLNKYLGTAILVSEEVIHDLDGFLAREAGRFRLKGKSHPLVVHELLCQMDQAEEKQKRACMLFSEALQAFRQRSWDEAREKFNQSSENSGTDGLTKFYLKLCEQYKKNPPEGPWEGVIDLEEK